MKKLILFVGLFLSSCIRPSLPPKPQELRPPVEVDIPQSFVTDGQLHVKVSLKPLVALKANQVAVDLIGVKQGQEVVKESLILSSLVTEEILKADLPLITDFQMNASDFEEYKVICRWSDQGVTAVEKTEKAIHSEFDGKFELLEQVLIRSDCKASGGDGNCERTYSIQGVLKNSTLKQITDVSLALEIKFVPTGQQQSEESTTALSPLTPDEQEVKLEGFTLSPGETRPIEVKIPEALFEIPEGIFVPKIRLFSYRGP